MASYKLLVFKLVDEECEAYFFTGFRRMLEVGGRRYCNFFEDDGFRHWLWQLAVGKMAVLLILLCCCYCIVA